MSTNNLCFRAKIRKIVYPYIPQFYNIKVGCKGVFVTRTCFRDEFLLKGYDRAKVNRLGTGLSRKRVERITYRPDMTSSV